MKAFRAFLFFVVFAVYSTSAQSPGAEVQNKVQNVTVFPNPASNVINVLGLENVDKATIHILDVYGNLVQKHRWEIKNNALNIPIPTLPAGIYVISIQSEAQQVQTKFYKQ